MNKKYYQQLDNAFLAHYARRLADLIIEQGNDVLTQLQLTTPASAVSTMIYLSQHEDVSGAQLADAFGVSHQMVTQRINALIKLNLIKRVSSKKDKRVKNVELTSIGKHEVTKIKPFTEKMTTIFDEIISEVGVDLSEVFQKTERTLLNKNLKQRFNEKLGAKQDEE